MDAIKKQIKIDSDRQLDVVIKPTGNNTYDITINGASAGTLGYVSYSWQWENSDYDHKVAEAIGRSIDNR